MKQTSPQKLKANATDNTLRKTMQQRMRYNCKNCRHFHTIYDSTTETAR